MHANYYQQLKHFVCNMIARHKQIYTQIEHNETQFKACTCDQNIYKTQTEYGTAKPFNLIDYKSRAQRNARKYQAREHKKKQTQRPKKKLCYVYVYYYNWRLFHWTNAIWARARHTGAKHFHRKNAVATVATVTALLTTEKYSNCLNLLVSKAQRNNTFTAAIKFVLCLKYELSIDTKRTPAYWTLTNRR